jgi:signal transduction histidine kinase
MDTNGTARTASVVPHGVLSAISHELRGPLGVARGYLRLLMQRDDLDDRARKAATEAEHATERIADLLDALADYTRLSRGDSPLVVTPTPAAALLEQAAAAITRPRAPEVTLGLSVVPGVELTADPRRLPQALAALASAVTCAQVEATRVVVAAAREAGAVVVTIGPEGVGNTGSEDPALRPSDPALRTAAAGTSARAVTRAGVPGLDERPIDLGRPAPGHGAGLGLALADLVVRLHGGEVVERWPGGVWRGYRIRMP